MQNPRLVFAQDKPRLPPGRLWPVLATLAAACQNDPSAGMAAEMAADMKPRCQLSYDLRAIDMVSTGAVTVSPQPGDPSSFSAEIDATAGGSMAYDQNPFVYLDLIGGKKVAVTDVQAPESGDWDIAFKRWQIKLNGGDSGPGGVGVAVVEGKTLADVGSAPPGPYVQDSYFDAQCMTELDPIGGLSTALSDWYDYDTATNALTPKKEVLVLTRRDQKGHIKLQINGYYKGMAGGNYAIAWSLLP
jgi:hypothetical protein